MSSEAAQKEYEVLQKLLLEGFRAAWVLERYCIVGVAAFWAWFFTHSAWRPWMNVAKFLPALLVLFAFFRMWAFLSARRQMRPYLLTIERKLGLGWEHFLDEQSKQKKMLSAWPAVVSWIALFVLCLGVGFAVGPDWLVAGETKGKP